MDELRRILDRDNAQYINEVKERWTEFCQKVQFYGVFKKIRKPPVGTGKAEQAIELLQALPAIFPSSSAPPKKLHKASEAFVHVLEESEDPNSFLRKRPLTCPVILISPSNWILALGDSPVAAFKKDLITEGLLYVMALYYALHLTYPKCVATVLSIIQSEVLLDSLHQQDQTSAFKKAISEWRAFVGK
ncbi:hypothetical protein ACEWY4_027337 [Coilia grayii]|uniref:FRIGIDA-like protein n=1 Tax=Coilia grayii TaxID=363190 RepID=A0ABD1IS61_9TELE